MARHGRTDSVDGVHIGGDRDERAGCRRRSGYHAMRGHRPVSPRRRCRPRDRRARADGERGGGGAGDRASAGPGGQDGGSARRVRLCAGRHPGHRAPRPPQAARVARASRHLRLASEDEIAHEFPGFDVGAVPPFGPLVPAAEVIDRRLLAHRRILCPAGDHHHSVLLAPRESCASRVRPRPTCARTDGGVSTRRGSRLAAQLYLHPCRGRCRA